MDFSEQKTDFYLTSLISSTCPGLNIYWVDTDNRVLMCNLAQAQSLGFRTPDELYGKNLIDIAKEIQAPLSLAEKLCDNNQQVILNGQSIVYEEELAPKGAHKYYLSHKTPFYNQHGHCLGILGISVDITEKKLLQEQLYRSKHSTDFYLESILKSSPNNIYWTDKKGRVLGCNDQQAKFFGLKNRLDMIDKTIVDISGKLGCHSEVAKKVRENDLRVITTRQPEIFEETILIDGKEKTFLSSKSPMLDENGEAVGILGISTDMTRQKLIEKELEIAREKAEASSQAKSRFIANISHDIRTPLVGIQGIAAELAEQIPEQYRPHIRSLINASNGLLALLNNVIQLTRLEYGEGETPPEPFDLYALVQQLAVLFTPVINHKGLSLDIQYAEGIPHKFTSWPMLIQRAILNLVGNALKFTEQGSVSIRVAADSRLPVSSKDVFPVLIIVEDTGIGIPADKTTEIFDRFFRVNPTYEGKYKGSGLGLSITHQFIKKLGGDIWVESVLGQGSRFYISLPLPIADAAADALTEMRLDEDTAIQIANDNPSSDIPLFTVKQAFSNQGAIKRVLLVEDHPLIQKNMVALLNKLNCFVDVAETAVQAVAMAELHDYDLIYLDIGLADHDGFWVARQIRQLSRHAATPVIALTAHLSSEYKQDCIDAGINDVITKPLSPQRAQAVLHAFCKEPC